MKKPFIICLLIVLLPACAESLGKPAPSAEPSPRQRYVVLPQDINAEYEVIGQVQLSSDTAANMNDLYNKLGTECAKMGGDMIINAQAGDQSQDTSKIHSIPPRISDNPRFPAERDISYTWGKGTVIRLKDEEQRKAYLEEMQQGDLEGACAIVGVPPAK